MTRTQAMQNIGKRVVLTDGVKPHYGEMTKVYLNAFVDMPMTARVAFDDGITTQIEISRLALA